MPYVVTCLKHQKIFNIYNLKCMMMYQLSSLKSEFVDKISISVEDLQTPSLPLIYQTEFSDNHLRIGDNILSQNWRQKKLSANFFRDKNAFGYIYVFIQHIYTHSVLFKWIISKLISVDLVASYFHTNFHFFFWQMTTEISWHSVEYNIFFMKFAGTIALYKIFGFYTNFSWPQGLPAKTITLYHLEN